MFEYGRARNYQRLRHAYAAVLIRRLKLRSRMAKLSLAALMSIGISVVPLGSSAAPLPSNCTKTQGSVTCTTFEGPGNNQAGVGTTTTSNTQGNTSNYSPAPQDTGTATTCKPPKSQGAPCP